MDERDCPFCGKASVFSASNTLVFYDRYPVSPGHMLVVPSRHFENYFEAKETEQQELWHTVSQVKDHLQRLYAPDGFNLGINAGRAAGQTVMHLHIHVIPRYRGDLEDPRGGVRGVIPSRQKY